MAIRGRKTTGKNKLFTLVLIFIPIVFFFVLELGLRLADYGEPYPLFTQARENPDYLMSNHTSLMQRFLGRYDSYLPLTESNTSYFLKNKPDHAFRIFVHGGSTAVGFPYGAGASIGLVLGQRLRQTFPDRLIEIVDTSMHGIGSYAIRDMVDEVIEQQPDAVLIYAGHNEYLGAMGVGSTLALGTAIPYPLLHALKLAYLALKKIRTFQLLEGFLLPVPSEQPAASVAATDQGRLSGVDELSKAQSIAFGSDAYRQGLRQFESNLSFILDRYSNAGIPVFIGTLVSNIRDQEPLLSNIARHVDVAQWSGLYQLAMESYQAQRYNEALSGVEHLIALDAQNADAHFLQAHVLDALGQYPKAYASYSMARDLDQMRFRAPDAFNGIIKRAAAQHGATIIDFEKIFRSYSPHFLVGYNLMLEYLHPTDQGYFLLSDGFHDGLQEAGMIGDWLHAVPDEEALRAMPLTEAERWKGKYIVAEVTSSLPLLTPRPMPKQESYDFEERLGFQLSRKGSENRKNDLALLMTHYREQHDDDNVLKISLTLADSFPFDAQAQYEASLALTKAGRLQQAIQYLERAVRYGSRQEYATALDQAKKRLM